LIQEDDTSAEVSDNDGVMLNINDLKKACLQKRAFLLLWHSVNIRSKMEQGPAITVPDWPKASYLSGTLKSLSFR